MREIVQIDSETIDGSGATRIVFGGTREQWLLWSGICLSCCRNAETMLEASRLAMVLALAAIGLVGSAVHQAQSLTLLQTAGAVFALGFSAGTLKNLITQKGAS